ncbi:MAG: hypothetical protein ACXAB7_06840 [Candidatus Kariarchaeaceae archaeon]
MTALSHQNYVLGRKSDNGTNSFESNSTKPEMLSSIESDQVNDGPTIGVPTWAPLQPASTDPVTVTSSVSDPDGVENATLFWQYEYNSSSWYNTSMSTSSQLIVKDDADFTRTGSVDASGVEIDPPSNWAFLEFIYEEQLITEVDIKVDKQGGQTALAYVKIDIKNATTGLWENRLLAGFVGNTNHEGSQTYQRTELIAGIKIYAISEIGGGDPPLPQLSNSDLWGLGSYEGDITPPNVPTVTSFYIQAYDTIGNKTDSPTYTVLMDAPPQVTISNLPVSTKEDISLAVTVFDPDGNTTVDKSSAVVYYRYSSETTWQSKPLTYLITIGEDLIFNTTIPISTSVGVEDNLLIVANVSDIVQGIPGVVGTSGEQTVVIDTLGPRLSGLAFITGTVFFNNTGINSPLNLTAIFTDGSGTKSATIYYSSLGGFDTLVMSNTTDPNKFSVILPARDTSGTVEYYFETTDFLDNTLTSATLSYSVDGDGPVIEADSFLIYPGDVIANTSEARILFNATDAAGFRDAILWYSIDGGISWQSTAVSPLDYNTLELPPETFDAKNDLPFVIANEGTSTIPLPVARKSNFQVATLFLGITHERSSDLRIWLTLDDGSRFLLFDREIIDPVNLANLEFDLLSRGLTVEDFNHNNFTLEIQDISPLYTGFVVDYLIELINYEIPIGYQYESIIPQTDNDTEVIFYITMTDNLNNVANSTEFSYHTDGIAPEVEVEELTSPLELKGADRIEVTATASDAGGIAEVELYYRFSDTEEWQILTMTFDNESSSYVGNIPLPIKSGNLTYWVRAFDMVGLSASSSIYTIVFEGGSIAGTSGDDGLSDSTVLLITAILASAAGIGVLVYLINSGKIKIPNRFKRS